MHKNNNNNNNNNDNNDNHDLCPFLPDFARVPYILQLHNQCSLVNFGLLTVNDIKESSIMSHNIDNHLKRL